MLDKKTSRSSDHSAAPLYEGLCAYAKKHHTSLHVPGHKDGRVFDQEARQHFSTLLKIDPTHLKGIDDLHHPRGFIDEAQQLAADIFGADHTFFLVGGSTIGNMAAALSLCSPGDKIIVQRNMHKSVFHGLLLAGAHPVYISPSFETMTNTAKMPANHYFVEALKKHPDAKGVWITNPSYYGMSQDITSLAKACHQSNVPLIVDEAHGAHFGLTNNVPPSALSQGADLVVQSTHKTLPAMTMASMLHMKGRLLSRERLAQVLSMIHSTSPSFPLLASLDLARRFVALQGPACLKETIKLLESKQISLSSRLKHLSIWEGSDETDRKDPLKWIISAKNNSVTGFQLSDMFYNEGCTAEISDPRNVCFLFSIQEKEQDVQKVIKAIENVDNKLSTCSQTKKSISSITHPFNAEGEIFTPELSLHEAFHTPRTRKALQDAEGAICGETVLPYPPGIPILTPGEKIKDSHIKSIRRLKESGAYFQHPSDETMKTLYILR